jgi:hypothetical protein
VHREGSLNHVTARKPSRGLVLGRRAQVLRDRTVGVRGHHHGSF